MRHLEKLSKDEICRRAKTLYFDKNPKIKTIFADEYGRFGYNAQNLVELNRISNAEVFEINKDALKGVKTDDVLDLSKDEDKLKITPEKPKNKGGRPPKVKDEETT